MQERKPTGGWRRGLAALPAVATTLLPSVT